MELLLFFSISSSSRKNAGRFCPICRLISPIILFCTLTGSSSVWNKVSVSLMRMAKTALFGRVRVVRKFNERRSRTNTAHERMNMNLPSRLLEPTVSIYENSWGGGGETSEGPTSTGTRKRTQKYQLYVSPQILVASFLLCNFKRSLICKYLCRYVCRYLHIYKNHTYILHTYL